MSERFSGCVRAVIVPILLCFFAGRGGKAVRGISTGLSLAGCPEQVGSDGH